MTSKDDEKMPEPSGIRKSNAKERKMLFKKKKGVLKEYFKAVDFKEPAMILLMRGNKAKFFENVTKGEFKFTGSDGEEKKINIAPPYYNFPYGDKTFKAYVCHEDFPNPLPPDPLITGEMLNIAVDKTLNDYKKWQSKEIQAKGEFWFKVGGAIALIIGAVALYRILVPQDTSGNVERAAGEAINNTVNGAVNQSPTLL